MSYLMGIDVGTTGTRVVIVRPDGHVMGAATGDHEPMRMPKPGWAEQDPENWWQAAVQAVRAVFESTGLSGKDIAAVGLSGQIDRKSTRLNSSHVAISYAVFCLKKKKKKQTIT